jgi:hypothetical protein
MLARSPGGLWPPEGGWDTRRPGIKMFAMAGLYLSTSFADLPYSGYRAARILEAAETWFRTTIVTGWPT